MEHALGDASDYSPWNFRQIGRACQPGLKLIAYCAGDPNNLTLELTAGPNDIVVKKPWPFRHQ